MNIHKNKILVVDDSVANQNILAQILQTEYIVFTAEDGESALHAAKKLNPDLILLDIVLPDIDGFKIMSKLKQIEETKSIPVMFITSLNNNADEQKGLMLGAVDYISKPFDKIIVKLRVHNQIKIINQMRMIEHLSMIDQLTGLPNRRNFDERLNAEWSKAIKQELSLGLMMIDVDHFKYYNDTYGHLQGDRALRLVSEIIMQIIKSHSIFAARWGGEEFAILLSDHNSQDCLEIGEKIRQEIENTVIKCVDDRLTKLTISIGINVKSPSQTSSIESFIAEADKTLYYSKNNGRNRISLYDEQIDSEFVNPIRSEMNITSKYRGEILLCEDNKYNQKAISDILLMNGLNVAVADNGKIGLEMVKNHQLNGLTYDAILMDICMPVMDGLEAAAEIAKLETGTPVIALTVNSEAALKITLMAEGISDSMVKAFTQEGLMNCLQKYLIGERV